MQTVTTVGLDIAKSVFQVHCVDAADQVVIRRQLKRRYVLAFFPEAAAVPDRHRSLRLIALLVAGAPGARAYGALDAAGLRAALLKRQKNDATDAEAICEAVTRANMRFVGTKTPEQQSCLMLHRTGHLLIPPADRGDQCNPGSSSGVQDRGARRALGNRRTTRGRGRSERQAGT